MLQFIWVCDEITLAKCLAFWKIVALLLVLLSPNYILAIKGSEYYNIIFFSFLFCVTVGYCHCCLLALFPFEGDTCPSDNQSKLFTF